MENSPNSDEEKFELGVSAVFCGVTWILQDQKTQIISVTFINTLEAEMVLRNLKNMIFIAKNDYIL